MTIQDIAKKIRELEMIIIKWWDKLNVIEYLDIYALVKNNINQLVKKIITESGVGKATIQTVISTIYATWANPELEQDIDILEKYKILEKRMVQFLNILPDSNISLSVMDIKKWKAE